MDTQIIANKMSKLKENHKYKMLTVLYRIFFLCILSSHSVLMAMPGDTVTINENTLNVVAGNKILVNHSYEFKEALQRLSEMTSSDVIDRENISRSEKTYWLSFTIYNPSDKEIATHIDAFMDEAYIDLHQVDLCKDLPCTGEVVRSVSRSYSTNVIVTPGYHTFTAKIKYFDLPYDFRPKISSLNALYKKENDFDYVFFLLISVFMGSILLLGFLALGIFLVAKDKAFLWYGIFCILLGLNSLRILTEHFAFLHNNPIYITFIYFKHFSAVALYISYTSFAFYFVNADSNKPWIYYGTRIFAVLSLMSIIPEIIFLVQGKFALSYSYYFHCRNAMSIYCLGLILLISKYRKEPFVKFILAGSSILLTSEIISNFLPKGIDSMVGTVGAYLEMGVFALGLSYRVKLQYSKRLQLLQENIEKTQLIADLQVEKSRLNMSVLQSQMNPHFIFNSLNSINRYILKNNKDEASYFLSQFSKLMRQILDSSVETSITLEAELNSVQLYLELESMRYNGIFTYQINIAEGIDLQNIIVPPIIIQPFVENSIKHGFINRIGNEKLIISISRHHLQTLIIIEDNGVGRSYSSKENALHDKAHKSKGLKITEDRIKNFSSITGHPCTLDIIDINQAGLSGTIVRILI